MSDYDSFQNDFRDLESHIKEILPLLNENPEREGLLETPKRVAKAFKYLTSGYLEDPDAVIKGALFNEPYNEMVIVKNIDFYSLCEHHLLPFYGNIHIAYIPNGKIVGLSKLPRVAEIFARRLQVQERLTVQIRDAIQNSLQPKGVAVVIEATHMCMVIRGVEKQNALATTSALSGVFLDNLNTRMEFMQHILNRK